MADRQYSPSPLSKQNIKLITSQLGNVANSLEYLGLS